MKNVTAIVISFLRPDYTIGCIQSLRNTYKDIHIVVGENGTYNAKLAEVCRQTDARYIMLPFDSGVCVGRNTLMEYVTTPYVLVGDDDFYYTTDTGVDRMCAFMEHNPDIDLIGGRVRENGTIRNYQGSIERNGRMLKNTPIDVEHAQYKTCRASGLRYITTDLVFNFFVARTQSIIGIPWDNEIKVAYEHESWFIDLQEAQKRVAFTPDCIVIHKPEHIRHVVEAKPEHAQYRVYRSRRSDKERFFTRHKLDYVVDMNGNRDDAPGSTAEKSKNLLKYVDFCVTTFKRPQALRTLLLSIAEFYPQANVYVADQNETLDREWYRALRTQLTEQGLAKRLIVEHLPYDCGLSYARNHLVTTTPNKYKLILDDDFQFTKDTDIAKFVALMDAQPGVGIVGGCVEQLGHEIHFEFTPEIRGDTIYHTTERPNWKSHQGIKYRKTGCVLNFALMRKDLFNHIQWDNELKVTEHIDFYLRMKPVPYTILYTPEVRVNHPPAERSDEYKAMRTRDEFMKKMLRKHGVRRVKYENRQVFELTDDGSIKHYRETV